MLALHEVFQAGEHHDPVLFRTLARLVGKIVVLMQRARPAAATGVMEPERIGQMTISGRIMSCSSCSRM